MIVLGITGSIGMGKSTAARMLRLLGVPVFDSDRAAHRALEKGKTAKAVAAIFPECWDKKKQAIDRKKLGAVVFNDPAKRRRLEEIVHPAVWEGQRRFIGKMQRMGRKVVGLDIPLLFETGANKRVDYTICVSAPKAIQRRRVLARPGMDEARLEKILQSQMSDGEKRALSDFVVQTGLGYAHSFRQLRDILRLIKATGPKNTAKPPFDKPDGEKDHA